VQLLHYSDFCPFNYFPEIMLESLGYSAGFLTTMAFVPQVVQIYKTKSAKDVSLAMFLLFTLGVAMWLVYGLITRSFPVVAANSVTLALSGVILYFKFRYR
jgi:MtN3 and saliva related transmembrane protein